MSNLPVSEDGVRATGAHHLTFSLDAEVFALDIRCVREIIQFGVVTPVPLMPRFVRGIINLRGAVVPVIDLQVRFGREPARVGKKTCIVIFDALRDGERTELGLMVDAVSEVVDIPHAQVEPPPGFGGAVARDFIRGIARMGPRFVTLLEPDRAFDVDDMARLCESAQELLAA